MLGEHNVRNALAAVSIAWELDIEEKVLAMLERLDPARELQADLDARAAALAEEKAVLEKTIKAEWKKIDGELARKEGRKQEALAPVPDDLVEMYENLRRSKEGVAIGRFEHGVCGGCHMTLSPAEQAEAWRRQAGALLELDEVADHDPPAVIEAELRPYQREGFGWLASLWELGLGGILADDMGLGKTLQTLAMVCHARERDPGVGPFLIVAPTSVVPNWVGEAARFACRRRASGIAGLGWFGRVAIRGRHRDHRTGGGTGRTVDSGP